MKKRITALLLSVVLCLGMLSMAAFAAATPSATGTVGSKTITVKGEANKLCALWGDEQFTELLLLFYTDGSGKATITVDKPLAKNSTYFVGVEGQTGDAVKVKIAEKPTEPEPEEPVEDNAAMIGDQAYTSLQEAVDAVENNGTLKVLKSGLSATVSKELVFTIELDEGVTAPEIKAGEGYELKVDGLKYTVTKKSSGGDTPSGGGSSGGGYVGGGSSTPSGYVVSVPSSVDNGTVKVSPSHATEGKKVTITATPDEGYVVGKIIVTDKDGNEIEVTDEGDGKYSFTMPKGKVDVKVEFVEGQAIEPVSFDDVPADAWYTDAVSWAVAKGITTGTGDNKFSPDMMCTRAQVVTFLWRAAGSPESTGTNPFTDVAEGTYYYDAVLWAVEKGITKGTTETTFSPDTVCTRAQIVTFLWRYEGTPEAAATSSFSDVAADAWYYDAVNWAVAKEVTLGTGNNQFSPDVACTRAQTVTLLYRDMA